MSCAGCQHKDVLKGMITITQGTRYPTTHTPPHHTRNLRRFLFLKRRFATDKHNTYRTSRTGTPAGGTDRSRSSLSETVGGGKRGAKKGW